MATVFRILQNLGQKSRLLHGRLNIEAKAVFLNTYLRGIIPKKS
jgi:hypothetical protein